MCLFYIKYGEERGSDQDREMKVEKAMRTLNVTVAASNHQALSICEPRGTFAQIPRVFSLVNRIHILPKHT